MVLETASLLTAAREQTLLADLGDDSILEGLSVLVDSLSTEAKLTEVGAQRWAASFTATLANGCRSKVDSNGIQTFGQRIDKTGCAIHGGIGLHRLRSC